MNVIVVDASVVATAVGDDGDDGRAARRRLAAATAWWAPDLVDVETVAVLRRRWMASTLSARRLTTAVDDLLELPITRVPTAGLLRRAVALRANVTPYDTPYVTVYVALAEALACPLVTADARLARATGVRCDVDVLGG
jgi:predicted nucleic acid-binding protein